MPTAKITAKLLDGMKPGDIYWDSEVKGFGSSPMKKPQRHHNLHRE